MPTITPAVLAGELAAATHPLSEPYKLRPVVLAGNSLATVTASYASDAAAKARTLDDVNTLRSIDLGWIRIRSVWMQVRGGSSPLIRTDGVYLGGGGPHPTR
jgi:hypothetical protein